MTKKNAYMQAEALEHRCFFNSAFAQLSSSGTLAIIGTVGDDKVAISQEGDTVVASLNNASARFPASNVRRTSVDANAGNDVVTSALPLPSTLLGGTGNDVLTGGPGNDSITGGSGDDTVRGEAGNDTLEGGDGNDAADWSDRKEPFSFFAASNFSANEFVDGVAHARAGHFRLYEPDADPHAELDVMNDLFETIAGGLKDDWFTGSVAGGDDPIPGATSVTFQGGAGNDMMLHYGGGRASYTYRGGPGNDRLVYLEGGNASFYGEGGNDEMMFGDTASAFFDGGTGVDKVVGSAIFDYPDLDLNDYRNVEDGEAQGTYRLIGTSGANHLTLGVEGLYADGGGGDDVIDATASHGAFGNITLVGGGGNDKLIGSAADAQTPASLDGGAGNDTLVGGSSNETLRGGDGNDTLDGGFGADIISGESGTDTADYSKRTANLTIGIGVLADDGEAGEHDNVERDIENVIGGSGNDFLRGSRGNNSLFGGAGNDTLDGDAGADFLSGGSGNDTADYSNRRLGIVVGIGVVADDGEAGEHDNVYKDIENVIGGSGNDVIRGTNGNNRLQGGNGNDTLIGLGGNDTLLGQAGSDVLYGRDGVRDTLDGGSGSDRAQRDSIDSVLSIEKFIA